VILIHNHVQFLIDDEHKHGHDHGEHVWYHGVQQIITKHEIVPAEQYEIDIIQIVQVYQEQHVLIIQILQVVIIHIQVIEIEQIVVQQVILQNVELIYMNLQFEHVVQYEYDIIQQI
jgi:hypothetical protein